MVFCWESAVGTAGGAAETKCHHLHHKFRLESLEAKSLNEDSPAVIGGRGGRDEDEQLALLDVIPIADALRKVPRVNMC